MDLGDLLGLILPQDKSLIPEALRNGIHWILEEVLAKFQADHSRGHDPANFLMGVNHVDHHFKFLHNGFNITMLNIGLIHFNYYIQLDLFIQ